MNLERLLTENRPAILQTWLDRIFETYPADTRRFLKEQKDRFANPVGTTISEEMGNLFGELLRGIDRERVSPSLDRIIRIRAIQDFEPSEALTFIFLLKKVVRDVLNKEVRKNRLSEELLRFDDKVDELALCAFDIYMRCREKFHEIRVNETRGQVLELRKSRSDHRRAKAVKRGKSK